MNQLSEMTMYYLQVKGGIFANDNHRVHLADLASAREEAIFALRVVIAKEVLEGMVPRQPYINITDELGQHLAAVSFHDAIEII
jgi:hypothetical protein